MLRPRCRGAVLPSLRDRRRGVRTRPEVIDAFTRELRSATTLPQMVGALQRLPARLRGTGVYRDVSVEVAPAAGGADGAPSTPDAVDVVLSLDEGSYSLNTGVFRTMDGRIETGLKAELLNPLGGGERLTLDTGAVLGELNLSQLTDVRAAVARGSAGGCTHAWLCGADRSFVCFASGHISPTCAEPPRAGRPAAGPTRRSGRQADAVSRSGDDRADLLAVLLAADARCVQEGVDVTLPPLPSGT
jgi:hypothetical protein